MWGRDRVQDELKGQDWLQLCRRLGGQDVVPCMGTRKAGTLAYDTHAPPTKTATTRTADAECQSPAQPISHTDVVNNCNGWDHVDTREHLYMFTYFSVMKIVNMPPARGPSTLRSIPRTIRVSKAHPPTQEHWGFVLLVSKFQNSYLGEGSDDSRQSPPVMNVKNIKYCGDISYHAQKQRLERILELQQERLRRQMESRRIATQGPRICEQQEDMGYCYDLSTSEELSTLNVCRDGPFKPTSSVQRPETPLLTQCDTVLFSDVGFTPIRDESSELDYMSHNLEAYKSRKQPIRLFQSDYEDISSSLMSSFFTTPSELVKIPSTFSSWICCEIPDDTRYFFIYSTKNIFETSAAEVQKVKDLLLKSQREDKDGGQLFENPELYKEAEERQIGTSETFEFSNQLSMSDCQELTNTDYLSDVDMSLSGTPKKESFQTKGGLTKQKSENVLSKLRLEDIDSLDETFDYSFAPRDEANNQENNKLLDKQLAYALLYNPDSDSVLKYRVQPLKGVNYLLLDGTFDRSSNAFVTLDVLSYDIQPTYLQNYLKGMQGSFHQFPSPTTVMSHRRIKSSMLSSKAIIEEWPERQILESEVDGKNLMSSPYRYRNTLLNNILEHNTSVRVIRQSQTYNSLGTPARESVFKPLTGCSDINITQMRENTIFSPCESPQADACQATQVDDVIELKLAHMYTVKSIKFNELMNRINDHISSNTFAVKDQSSVVYFYDPYKSYECGETNSVLCWKFV